MISDLILIAKKFSVPSAYGRRDGVRDFFAQFPDGVYIATDAGAPAGWEGYAVWFGGTGERYAERFMELIRDGYIVERFLRARVGGLLVFTFRCRLKMRRFGTLGKPNDYIDWSGWDGLLFTAVDGASKVGMKIYHSGQYEYQTRTIQYSIDGGNTWQSFTTSDNDDYFCTIPKGRSVAVKGFASRFGYYNNSSDYYGNSFIFTGKVKASGNVKSLINNSDVITQNGALAYLFRLAGDSLLTAPYLPYETLPTHAYRVMFYDCSNISRIDAAMTSIQTTSLRHWVTGVSDSGDFYCPAELTIPTGVNGIPTGWTRHDI